MSEKVMLPPEIAADIEELRCIDKTVGQVYEDVLAKWSIGEFELMSALVNGYTVERSPQENVREYYESLRVDKRRARGFCSDTVEEVSREIEGITKTLDLLGIKIEGVNA